MQKIKPFWRSKTIGFIGLAVVMALQSPVKEALEGKKRSPADYWDIICIGLIAGGTAWSRAIAQGPLSGKPDDKDE